MFNEADQQFMQLALHAATVASAHGDFPVGAALSVDGHLWGTGRNGLFSTGRTTAHAEHTLLYEQSANLRKIKRAKPDTEVVLYTTLEPCIMCLGITVMHRVSRVVVACPDPYGGAVSTDYTQMGSIYERYWPTFETGLFKETSCDLIIDFLKREKNDSWEQALIEFSDLRSSWETS